MEQDEVRIPLYYVLKRKLSDKEVEKAQQSLRVTPCFFAILTHEDDYDLAKQFCQQVLWCPDKEALHTTAEHTARTTGWPVLVIGESSLLDAVYHDGAKEKVC